jgi:ATP-dependent helicase/nuclease subunit A
MLPDSRADLAADAAARAQALDPTRSCIVQAPAGSGKTTLLASRYLKLLPRVRRPEDVVAITFTRKAASEMRARVHGALERAAAGADARHAADRELLEAARAALAHAERSGWHLLEAPAQLEITTIDALNQRLARQLPLLARLGAPPVIEPDPRPCYREAATRTVEALGEGGEIARDVALVLEYLNNDADGLVDLLAAALERRDQWLPLLTPLAAGGESQTRAELEAAWTWLVADALRIAYELIRADCDELAALLAPALARQGQAIRLSAWPAPQASRLADWQALVAALLTAENRLRKRFAAAEGFAAPHGDDGARVKAIVEHFDQFPAITRALRTVRRLPVPRYDERQWRVLRALIAVQMRAAGELTLAFAARGAIDFAEVAARADLALGESEAPSELALVLDRRIEHLLVDEFQDISRSQVQLLSKLMAGWTPGDGRTIFCVGDPMQSIYRFRSADVALFLKVRDHGLADHSLTALSLSSNYRSQPAIVDWVNRVFARVLPPRDDLPSGAVRYWPAIATPTEERPSMVRLHALPGFTARDEGAWTADLVSQIRARRPQATIAVLGRARAHLAPVATALQASGLAFQGIKLIGLADRLAVRDLLSLTRAVVHLADRVAWLACLRAPWCGLTLPELHALAGDDADATILELCRDPARRARLTPAALARLDRTLSVLDQARAERGSRPLSLVVESAWLELGGPATVEHDVDLENARRYLERLAAVERAGDLDDPALLAGQVADLYAAADPHADERLQLMTVHGAKGLEWDVVVLCGLGRGGAPNSTELVRDLEFERDADGPGLVLAPLRAPGTDTEPLESYVRHVERERDRLEEARLLYVAATRARDELHLVGHLVQLEGEPPRYRQPGPQTALGLLWGAIEGEFKASVDTGLKRAPAATRASLRRLAPDFELPPLPPPIAAPPRVAAPPAAPEFIWVETPARLVGTVVHEELARMAREGHPGSELAARAAHRRRRLSELGVAPAALPGAEARVAEALERTLHDPRGRWLLARHAESRSEWALTGLLDGALATCVIDRSFVDAGTRWVVDFKASVHEGTGVEAFLDEERLRYREQLERYAALVRRLDPDRPIRLALYFPLLSGWREWAAS